MRGLSAEPPEWLRAQAAKCRERGAPKNLLRPLAVAVASHLYGTHERMEEVLPAVEARFHPLNCECEECS